MVSLPLSPVDSRWFPLAPVFWKRTVSQRELTGVPDRTDRELTGPNGAQRERFNIEPPRPNFG